MSVPAPKREKLMMRVFVFSFLPGADVSKRAGDDISFFREKRWKIVWADRCRVAAKSVTLLDFRIEI